MIDVASPRKYPVLIFLLLVYLLAIPILFASRLDVPFELLVIYGSWTPNIAAFIVLGLVLREKGGIRRLTSGWKKWRVGGKWYLAALSPALISFLGFALYRMAGGAYSPPDMLADGLIFQIFVFSLITGALGEELGWRGFLLPRLQTRFGPFVATILVGIVWALWHLPLWFIPGSVWQESIPYWAFALVTISSSFLYTWVVNSTDGSMLMASLIHFTMNFAGNIIAASGLVPIRELYILSAILYLIYAGVIVLVSRPSLGMAGAGLIPAGEP